MKTLVRGVFLAVLCAWGGPVFCDEDQERLEFLVSGFEPEDNFPDGEPPDIPFRNRDALPDFQRFMSRSGWTTNQLVEGLIRAVSNNLSSTVLDDREKSRVPRNAIWKLSEINHPAVTNFFRELTASENLRLDDTPIVGMFYYTDLEPEVLAYMRSVCVRTNLYSGVAADVMYDMLRTLDGLPDPLKPAATNRVAKYIYFSIQHTTQDMAEQDRTLARFVPAYSNSVQRLRAMHYLESTATNARQRVRARMEIDRLGALPAGQLNDLPWLESD